MRVLLIPPIFHYHDNYPSLLSLSDFPSGFAYVAAALEEAGHEVFGLNLNNRTGYADGLSLIKDKMPLAIDKVKPDLIGLGGICVDYAFIRDAIRSIRVCSNTPIVLGGGIVSNDPEIFEMLKPDYAIIGEAEEQIVRLANTPLSLASTGELRERTFRSEVFATKRLDELPFPDYEPFGINDMMDNFSFATRLLYRYSRTHPRPYNIVTARSCPFNCTFCQHNRGIPYRARSIDNIMEEIKQTYEKYHFNILIILDELFVANKKRMNEFCTTLIDMKREHGWDFDWMFQTHANAHLDKESLGLAKEAGCFFFSYGLESASQRVLDSMNKKTKVSQAIEAIQLAKEAKVGFGGNLIFGDPAETEETISESLAVYYEHCRSAFAFLSFIQPYPGSKIFDVCLERGIIKDKRTYYENIDKCLFNMTAMDDNIFGGWAQILGMIERGWLQVRLAKGHSEEDTEATEKVYMDRTETKMYKITATCPYCGEEIHYRDAFPKTVGNIWMGTGCTKCNQRIRIQA